MTTKVGEWTVSLPKTAASIEPDQPIYTVIFTEDCEICGSVFLKGQQFQGLAEGVFRARGKALVYDWASEQWVPITDALPRLPL